MLRKSREKGSVINYALGDHVQVRLGDNEVSSKSHTIFPKKSLTKHTSSFLHDENQKLLFSFSSWRIYKIKIFNHFLSSLGVSKRRASKEQIFRLTGIIAKMYESSCQIIYTSHSERKNEKRGTLSKRKYYFNEIEILGSEELCRKIAAGMTVRTKFTHRPKANYVHAQKQTQTHTHTHAQKHLIILPILLGISTTRT